MDLKNHTERLYSSLNTCFQIYTALLDLCNLLDQFVIQFSCFYYFIVKIISVEAYGATL